VIGLARLTHLLKWVAVSVASVGAVLTAGLALVAVVAQAGSTDTWSRWSNAGQAFGVLTAVFSGFALAALVITFWMQLQELKAQRMELCQQRELLGQARAALHRSAEADLAALHHSLIKMAMDDGDLAKIWPPLGTGLAARSNRQYLYANLIIQHHWLRFQISDYTEAELRSVLRYLFSSPLMREFWRSTERSRATFLLPGTQEFLFHDVAADVFREWSTGPDAGAPRLATVDGPTTDEASGPDDAESRQEAA
jgi:hypothetical protein